MEKQKLINFDFEHRFAHYSEKGCNHRWNYFPGVVKKSARYFSKNQNAIGHPHSENEGTLKEDQQVQSPSSKSTTITRRISKPSRQESVQIATPHTRKRQRDRGLNYRHRLQEDHLYSLIVSSNGIECYGTNCQPSVFNTSHRCRTISSEKNLDLMEEFPLMNDQDIKQTTSYVSLTNLSNLIDHEPNVSRRDSYSRSTSSILMHKPSLFLADIFNKMTREQRAKSIAQLAQYHENLTKSNTTTDNLQRSTSLPNLDHKLTKLHSVTSLLSEKTIDDRNQMNIETPSCKQIGQETLSNKRTIDLSKSSDQQTTFSPKRKISHENMHTNISSVIKPSPIFIQSSKSNTTIDSEKTKTSRSNNFLSPDSDEHSSKSNPIVGKTKMDFLPAAETNLQDANSKSSVKQNREQFDSKNDMNQQSKAVALSAAHSQLSNGENEIENSLNDATDHLSQQDTTISSTNLEGIPAKELKQSLSLLQTIDEGSQHSQSSYSDPKNSMVLNPTNNASSTLPTKYELTPLLPINDGDTSVTTRATTASTNLTSTNDVDNDDQSKLINEQLKRSSLGLARNSLELLRDATPHHASHDEQVISPANIDSTPHPRKSVLKSHFDSSDNLPTLDLISYVAIDEVKGDKHLLEEHMRRRSLTLGNGGTVISCISPKPKRDSLTLFQERYSESTTPHSAYYHLSGSENKHVEFIREPGVTITPVLHVGRGIKSKHPSNKSFSPSSSQPHSFYSQTINSLERRKSDTSVMDSPRTSKTTSFVHTNDIEAEKICFNKTDYDEMIRLLMTPSSEKKRNYPIETQCQSNIELYVNHRLTTFQNLILVVLLISFYVFVLIKSQYWQEH